MIDEVAGAVVFTHVLLGEQAGEAYLDHVVDEILLPLLSMSRS